MSTLCTPVRSLICLLLLAAGTAFAQFGGGSAEVKTDAVRMTTFDGRTPIRIPADPRLTFGHEGTIEFWVKWRESQGSSQDFSTILSITDTDGLEPKFAIAISNNGQGIGIVDKKGKLSSPVPFRFDDNALHHVALVTKGQRTTIYIDGELSATGTQPFGYQETPKPSVILGALTRQRGQFVGSIGDLRIWRTALTSSVISKKRILGTTHETLFRLLTLHPNYHNLVLYSAFSDIIEDAKVFYTNPMLGMWMERSWVSFDPIHVSLLDSDELSNINDTIKDVTHGTYVRPPIYTGVASSDPARTLIYQDSVYYGLMVDTGNGNYVFTGPDIQGQVQFRMSDDGKLVSERGGFGKPFQVKKDQTKIVLERPTWNDEPFVEQTAIAMEQAVFSGFAQQFDNNFIGWNLITVNPFMPAMTGKKMKYIFQKPSNDLKPSATGMFIPSCLTFRPVSVGSASSVANVSTSGRELGTTSSLSMGLAAEIDIMDNGGGFEINAEIKKETNKMKETSTTKITAQSILLKHALVANMAQMELDSRFRERVEELLKNGDFDAFFDEYGTHFPYAVSYGGMMFMETNISSESMSEATKESFDIKGSVEAHVGKKGFGKASMKASAGFGQGKSEKISNMFENTEINIWWSGGDGMMSADPASTQNPLGDSVTPVYLDLRPIYQLLSPQYFTNPRVYNELRLTMVQKLNVYVNRNNLNEPAPPPPPTPDRYVEVTLQHVTLGTVKAIGHSGKITADLTPPKMTLHVKAQDAGWPIGRLDGSPMSYGTIDLGEFSIEGPDEWQKVDRTDGKPIIVDSDEERKKVRKTKENQDITRFRFRVPGNLVNGGVYPGFKVVFDPFMRNYTLNESYRGKNPSMPDMFPKTFSLHYTNISETPRTQDVSLDGTFRSEWHTKITESLDREIDKLFRPSTTKYKHVKSDRTAYINFTLGIRLVPSYGMVYSAELEKKMRLMRQSAPPPEKWRAPALSPVVQKSVKLVIPQRRVGERPLMFPSQLLVYYPLEKDLLDYSGLETDPLVTRSQIIKDAALAVSPSAPAKTYVRDASADGFTVHLDFYPMSEDDFGLLNIIDPEVLSVTSKGGLLQATVCGETTTLLNKPLALGRWHKLIAVWDMKGHRVRLFVDSLPIQEMKIPISYRIPALQRERIAKNGIMIELGQRRLPFKGLVDEIMVFKRPLSNDLIAELNVRPREAGEAPVSEQSMFDDSTPEFGGSWLVGALAPLHEDLANITNPSLLFAQEEGILRAPLISAQGRTFAHLRLVMNRKGEVRLELEKKDKSTPIIGWVGTLNEDRDQINWLFEDRAIVTKVVQTVDRSKLNDYEKVALETKTLFKIMGQGPDKCVIAKLPPTLAPMAGTFKAYDTNRDGTITYDEAYTSMLLAANLDPNAAATTTSPVAAANPASNIPTMQPWRRFDLSGKWRQDNQDQQTSLVYEITQTGMQLSVATGGFIAYEGDYLGESGLEFRKNGEVIGALLAPSGQFITLDDGNIWKRLDELGNPPGIEPPPFASRSGYYDRGREDLLVVRQYGISRTTFFLVRENDPTGGRVLESTRTGNTYRVREGFRTYQASWDGVDKLTIVELNTGDELTSIAGAWNKIDLSGDWHDPVNGGNVHIVSKNAALYVYDRGFHNITGMVTPKGLQFSQVANPDAFFRARLQPPGSYLRIQFNDVITWKRGKFTTAITDAQLEAEMTAELAKVKLGSEARRVDLENQIRDLKVQIASPRTLVTDVPQLKLRLETLQAELMRRYPEPTVTDTGPTGEGFLTGRWRDKTSGFVYGLYHTGNQVEIKMITEAGKIYWQNVTATVNGNTLDVTVMNVRHQVKLSESGNKLIWNSDTFWDRLTDKVMEPVLTGVWIDQSDASVFTITQDFAKLTLKPVGGPKATNWPEFEATHRGKHFAYATETDEVKINIENDGTKVVFANDLTWTRMPALTGAWFDSQGGHPITIKQDGLQLDISCDTDEGASVYAKTFTATQEGLILSIALPSGTTQAIVDTAATRITFDANRTWQRVAPLDGTWKETKSNLTFSVSATDDIVTVTPAKALFPGMKFVGALTGQTVTMTFGVLKATGTISADNATITWSDGRVWKKTQ